MNNVLSGADALIFINGKGYGLASSQNIQINTPLMPSQTIDTHLPHEFMPSQGLVKVVFTVYRAITQGDWEGYRLASPMNQLPTQTPISIKVVNRKTQTVLWQFDNAVVERQTWAIMAQRLVQGEISLSARAISNDFTDANGLTTPIHYASERFGQNTLRTK